MDSELDSVIKILLSLDYAKPETWAIAVSIVLLSYCVKAKLTRKKK